MAIDWSAARQKAKELDKETAKLTKQPSSTGRGGGTASAPKNKKPASRNGGASPMKDSGGTKTTTTTLLPTKGNASSWLSETRSKGTDQANRDRMGQMFGLSMPSATKPNAYLEQKAQERQERRRKSARSELSSLLSQTVTEEDRDDLTARIRAAQQTLNETKPKGKTRSLLESNLLGTENVASGLLRGVEAPVAAVESAGYQALHDLTSLGGQAENPLSRWAERSATGVQTLPISSAWQRSIQERYQPNETEQTVMDVTGNIASMLPSLALSAGIGAAAGAGQGAAALTAAGTAAKGQRAGQLMMALQGMGSAAKEARDEGASVSQANLYGAADGLLGAATERISGGIPLLGGGVADKALSRVKSPLVRAAADMAGEGFEEGLQTAAEPFLKRAVYDPDARNATLSEIGQSAAMGALASGALKLGIEAPQAVESAVRNFQAERPGRVLSRQLDAASAQMDADTRGARLLALERLDPIGDVSGLDLTTDTGRRTRRAGDGLLPPRAFGEVGYDTAPEGAERRTPGQYSADEIRASERNKDYRAQADADLPALAERLAKAGKGRIDPERMTQELSRYSGEDPERIVAAFESFRDLSKQSPYETAEDGTIWRHDLTRGVNGQLPDPKAPLDRDITVDRKSNAYSFDHPELRPYIVQAADGMKADLANTIQGERTYRYDRDAAAGEDPHVWSGIKRQTAPDIAAMLDGDAYGVKMSYKTIDDGLDDILADHGKENSLRAKRVEAMLVDRLQDGYQDAEGRPMPPDDTFGLEWEALQSEQERGAADVRTQQLREKLADTRSIDASEPPFAERDFGDTDWRDADIQETGILPASERERMEAAQRQAEAQTAEARQTGAGREAQLEKALQSFGTIDKYHSKNEYRKANYQKGQQEAADLLRSMWTDEPPTAQAFSDRIDRLIRENYAYGKNDLETRDKWDRKEIQSGIRAMERDILSSGTLRDESARPQTAAQAEPSAPAQSPQTGRPVGPESSVGAAEKGFDPWSAFQGTKSQFYPEGPNAARPVDVPTTDADGDPVRKSASTIMGARAVTDETAGMVQDMVRQGRFSYTKAGDEASVRQARQTIESDGFQRSLEKYAQAVRNGAVSKDMVTLGQQLLINASNAGDGKATAELLTLYGQSSTNTAQALQAQSILRKLDPEYQLYAVQKTVDRLNEDVQRRQGDKLFRRRKTAEALPGADGGADAETARVWKQQRDEALDIIRTMAEGYREDGASGKDKTWVQMLGDDLASAASRRAATANASGRSIYQTIESDLQAFMRQYVDAGEKGKTAKRTAAERLTDYFANRSEYDRAWKRAQRQLREKYKGDKDMSGRLEDFLQNRPTARDDVMTQAAAEAVKAEGIDKKQMTVRRDYDADALAQTIGDRLVRETGARGADETAVRNAVRRYIEDQAPAEGRTSGDIMDRDIRTAMKDAGVKMAELIQQSRGTKQAAAQRIADMLVDDYDISKANARTVADQVTRQFQDQVAEAGRKKVESLFRDRPERVQKSALQRFDELANMGAFDGEYAERATSRVMGTEGITIDPDLLTKYLQAEDQVGRDAVMEEIYQNVADQVPSNWEDKWRAWRYFSMLLAPRTHGRNLVGNAGGQVMRVAKDEIAAGIEAVVSRASGGKLQRTKTFAASPSLYKAAAADFQNVAEDLSGSHFDDVKGQIQDRRTIFKKGLLTRAVEKAVQTVSGNKEFQFTRGALEAATKGNSAALGAEDTLFKKATYADALAKFLQANHVTAEQFQSGQADPDLVARGRDYASREAMKHTFNDHNDFSDAVASLGSRGAHSENAWVRRFSRAVEAVLPFKRTPANILVRGAEYSPAGLAKSLTVDLAKVKQGRMSGAEAIDNIAQGLTGTGVMVLGALLAKSGLLTGSADSDEEEAKMDELTGGQDYALNLPGGTNVTLDWLAPASLPLFMGVEMYNAMAERDGTDAADSALTFLGNSLKTVEKTADPMLEMTMLQSLNDLLTNHSYDDGSPFGRLVASAATSYVTQALPSLLGQLGRTIQDKRYTTYTDKNVTFPTTDMQYTMGKTIARLPFSDKFPSTNQVPYIDAWGREEKTGTLPERAFNNFLNPAYVSRKNETAVDKEIRRLYRATGDKSVVPDRFEKSVSIDGKKVWLDQDQYVTAAKKAGQAKYDALDKLIATDAYQKADDARKAELVDDIMEYGNAVGRMAATDWKPAESSWVSKAVEAEQSGIDIGTYVLYHETKDANGDGTVSQGEAAGVLLPMKGLTDAQKSALWKATNSGWNEKKDPFTGALPQGGLSVAQSVKVLQTYQDIEKADYTGEKVASQKQTAFSKALDGMGLTKDQRAVVDDTYKFYTMMPAKVQAYSVETMSEAAQKHWPALKALHMSEEAYLQVYPIVAKTEKGYTKADKIRDLMALGYSRSQANTIYSKI